MKILSILIPVYRVALYLPELLAVLLPQLTEETELIFYDDASPDESVAIIQQAHRQWPQVSMRIMHGEYNIGLTAARARLLGASQASYVWFIDSDDRVDGTAVRQILAILNQFEPDVLLFDYDVFYDGSNQIKRHEHLKIKPVNKLAVNIQYLLYRMAILDGKHYFWNKVFHRQHIIHVVSYDIPAYEDMAYTPILLNQCWSYYYLPHALVHYRIRKDSIAQKMGMQQIYGLQAYMEQARYAAGQVGDYKSEAYLWYKLCIYYFRIKKRIYQAALSVAEKEILFRQLNLLYEQKDCSEWQIVLLLCRYGLVDKAAKLAVKKCLDSINKSARMN